MCRGYAQEKTKQKPKYKKSQKAYRVNEKVTKAESNTDTEEEYCFGVGKTPTVDVQIKSKNVKFFVDTGASINIIDEKTAKCLDLNLEETKAKIHAYGQAEPLKVNGKATENILYKNVSRQETFFVVKSTCGNLLSAHTAQELGLVKFAFSCQTSLISEAYPDLFEGIGKMKNVKVELFVDPTVKPVVQPHRRIPFHMRKKVEKELKRLEDEDIIEKVDGPTPWVSPIVVAPKPKKPSEIRLCVDMRLPNQAIKRTRHITPTLDDIVGQLNQSTVFSKLDLTSGYHQLELDEKSRNITTFTTHVGLRRYKRLNFGVTSAAEVFQNHISEILSDITGALNTSDDILVHGQNQEEHDRALIQVLDRLREKGLTLNKEKCQFNKDRIEFYGFVFGKDGISPDMKKVESIKAMQRPTSQKEVRSFLGMTNYISRFIPHYADTTKPLRDLTRKNVEFAWCEEQEKAFVKLKELISDPKSMAYFNEKSETKLVVDASPIGLAAILTQVDKRGKESIVAYSSRALTDVETRYSQTEREALAVVWACEYFHLYVHGCKFEVISDHKPLEGIFNRPTSRTNARIERWNLRLQTYHFTLTYKPGDTNPADFLSRHPVVRRETSHETRVAEEYISFIMNETTPKAMTLPEIARASREDPTLQAVRESLIRDQWQTPKNPSVDCTAFLIFKTIQNELSLCDDSDILLRGDKIVIPQALQHKTVDIAHEGHQGLVKTKSLVREKVWFPNIDKFVESKITSCLACSAATPAKSLEPMKTSPLPAGPWTEVSIDFCGPLPSGDYLLVVVDDYSRFPEVVITPSTSAKSTIPRLHAIFACHGIPEIVKSDNGPPFNSQEFSNFAKYLGFHHRKITPLWPQANGGAERMMRTLKKTLQTAQVENKPWKQELYTFLRNYRATPHSTTGVSPAEALFNRKVRTRLPEIPVEADESDMKKILIRRNDTENKIKWERHFNENRSRSDIKVGDNVLVKQPQNNKLSTPFSPEPMTIISKKGPMLTAKNHRRSITRNSSHFKKISSTMKTDEPPEEIEMQDEAPLQPEEPTAPSSPEANPTPPSLPEAKPPTPTATKQTAPIRKSSRVKTAPSRLKDYELSM